MKKIVAAALITALFAGCLTGCMLKDDNSRDNAGGVHIAEQQSLETKEEAENADIMQKADAVLESSGDVIEITDYWDSLKPELEKNDGTSMLKTIYLLSERLCGSGKTVLFRSYNKEIRDTFRAALAGEVQEPLTDEKLYKLFGSNLTQFDFFPDEWVESNQDAVRKYDHDRYINVLLYSLASKNAAILSENELGIKSINGKVEEDIYPKYKELCEKYTAEYIKNKTYNDDYYFIDGKSDENAYIVFIGSLKECFGEYLFEIDMRGNGYNYLMTNNHGKFNRFAFLPMAAGYGYSNATEFYDDCGNWSEDVLENALENGYVISIIAKRILKFGTVSEEATDLIILVSEDGRVAGK